MFYYTKPHYNWLIFIFQIDGMSMEEMGKTIVKYNMKSPLTNNDLSEPMEFNLMFSTAIGPTGHIKGWIVIGLWNACSL